ncbi:MAG: Rib/alpha-like domain-containing protein [Peptoniphilus harei]|nr:Rib/alpha-like domain-containing protein [Peptoniphilus harei]
MNRKMFSLVTSLAILSSSFSPTWAAGKNFTYNNLEKSLAIHAEAKEVKSSEAKEELPLVRETMPDDSVKDKYARIIFVPKTSKVDGVQNFGKLLDKDNKEVLLSDISYKNNIIKGKEYYVLKDAKWKNILFYKENNKQVLSVRKAVNNESDPDKKKVHEFLAWTRNGIKVEPFYDTYPINIKSHSIENPLIFTAIFQTSPYFYSLDDSRNFDSDGYRIYRTYIGKLIVDEYNEVLFMATSEDDKLMGDISLYDSQKKYANYEGDFSKKIYLYIRKNSGTHSFADFKPETINSEGKTFWFWSVDSDFSGPVEDDFDIGKIDQVYRAQFIVDYIRIHDNFDLGKNPIPSGCYEVDFQAEDGYLFRNPLRYKRYAVREGKTLEGIISKFSLEPKLKDKNNVEYKGKVAWYDGFTKIDNIKEVKINSNKVFTARRVRDFESEKFNSVVKEVKVKLNEDVSSEKLKEGITNLPKNVEVEIKTKADTSKVGQTKAVLKITFSDTSSKEVEVPIKVIEREDGKLITPIPTIGAEDIIKEEVPYNGKIDLSDNIKNLPDGAKIEDVSDSINTKTPGKYIGKVKVTFKDGSSRIVEILVEVLAPLSDSYNPSTKEVEVKLNEDVSPEKLKEGITNLPKNVEVEIKTKADTSKAGKTKAVLKLIFSDTSVKEVKVLVKVVEKIDGGIVKPIPTIKAEDIIKEKVSYNGKINLLDNIKNIPSEAKVEDISETIDTKTPGSYVGKVKVTFKDGSSRIVEIPIEVLAPLAEKFQVKKPEKTKVEKLDSLSSSEKSEIMEKVKKVNSQALTVEVSDRGEVTLIYSDGSKNIISSEDTIVLKEKENDKKDPEDKPGKEEDKKDSEDKPEKEENKEPEEKPGKEDKKDPEDKPDKKEDKKKSEENNEEARDNKENKLDSWNEFPIYYVRDYVTPTYKVDVKINSHVADTKTQVNPKKFVIDIKSGTYTLTEDGKTLEKSMEVKPIIENNRTMLPLRALAEILGAKVIWNDATRTASFTRDGLTALIQIDGNKIVLSNGKTIDLEAKPLNVNGRIYLPLVYVGQVFGLTSGNADYDKENDIEWKEESKTVTINIK